MFKHVNILYLTELQYISCLKNDKDRERKAEKASG